MKNIIKNKKMIRNNKPSWELWVEGMPDPYAIVPGNLTMSGSNVLGIQSDGYARGWGDQGTGILGHGDSYSGNIEPPGPDEVLLDQETGDPIGDIVQVSAFTDHLLFLTTDKKAYATGRNYMGEIGNTNINTGDYTYYPVRVMAGEAGEEGEYLENVIQVSAGQHYSMALLENGEVYTWGMGNQGRLGTGETDDETTPVKILENVKYIYAAQNVGFAVKNDGTLYCWGYNFSGQLGLGNRSLTNPPEANPYISDIKKIYHTPFNNCTLFLKNDGTVYGAGDNTMGQLATGSTQDREEEPVQCMLNENEPLENIKDIALTWYNSVFVNEDGKVFTCGEDSHGSLGIGANDGDMILYPEQVEIEENEELEELDHILEVTAKVDTVVCLRTDGSIWGWGQNAYMLLHENTGENWPEAKKLNIDNMGLEFEESIIKVEEIDLSQQENLTSTLTLNLPNEEGRYNPENPDTDWHEVFLPNRKIELKQGYGVNKIITFTGLIDYIDQTTLPYNLEVVCSDMKKYIDDQLITDVYGNRTVTFENEKPEDIFEILCIWAGFEQSDIITGETNIIIPKITFDWQFYNDAVDELAEIAGFIYFCDEQGKAYFISPKRQLEEQEEPVYTFEEGKDLISISYNIPERELYSKVIARATNEDTGEEIYTEKDFPEAEFLKVFNQKILPLDYLGENYTEAELEEMAEKEIEKMKEKARQCTIDVIAVPFVKIGNIIKVIEKTTKNNHLHRVISINSNQSAGGYIQNIMTYRLDEEE